MGTGSYSLSSRIVVFVDFTLRKLSHGSEDREGVAEEYLSRHVGYFHALDF